MFIPCEGIGSAIAKILKETGITLGSLEFFEDKCIAVFSNVKTTPKAPKPKVVPTSFTPETMFKYPAGPWTKTEKAGIWACEDYRVKTRDLAIDRGVKSSVMTQRLTAHGYLDPQRRKSKFEKDLKGKRMSLP